MDILRNPSLEVEKCEVFMVLCVNNERKRFICVWSKVYQFTCSHHTYRYVVVISSSNFF